MCYCTIEGIESHKNIIDGLQWIFDIKIMATEYFRLDNEQCGTRIELCTYIDRFPDCYSTAQIQYTQWYRDMARNLTRVNATLRFAVKSFTNLEPDLNFVKHASPYKMKEILSRDMADVQTMVLHHWDLFFLHWFDSP